MPPQLSNKTDFRDVEDVQLEQLQLSFVREGSKHVLVPLSETQWVIRPYVPPAAELDTDKTDAFCDFFRDKLYLGRCASVDEHQLRELLAVPLAMQSSSSMKLTWWTRPARTLEAPQGQTSSYALSSTFSSSTHGTHC